MSSTNFLVDTNVVSELCRRAPNPGVWQWAEQTREFAISVVTLEELEFGLTRRPKPAITRFLDRFLAHHVTLLPVTAAIARRAGRLRAELASVGQVREQADMMIAATAIEHQLTLVTRNVQDFASCPVPVLDPFSPG